MLDPSRWRYLGHLIILIRLLLQVDFVMLLHVGWEVLPLESVVQFLSSSAVGSLRRIEALYGGLVYGMLGSRIGLQGVLDGHWIHRKSGLAEGLVVGLKRWLLVPLFVHVQNMGLDRSITSIKLINGVLFAAEYVEFGLSPTEEDPLASSDDVLIERVIAAGIGVLSLLLRASVLADLLRR